MSIYYFLDRNHEKLSECSREQLIRHPGTDSNFYGECINALSVLIDLCHDGIVSRDVFKLIAFVQIESMVQPFELAKVLDDLVRTPREFRHKAFRELRAKIGEFYPEVLLNARGKRPAVQPRLSAETLNS